MFSLRAAKETSHSRGCSSIAHVYTRPNTAARECYHRKKTSTTTLFYATKACLFTNRLRLALFLIRIKTHIVHIYCDYQQKIRYPIRVLERPTQEWKDAIFPSLVHLIQSVSLYVHPIYHMYHQPTQYQTWTLRLQLSADRLCVVIRSYPNGLKNAWQNSLRNGHFNFRSVAILLTPKTVPCRWTSSTLSGHNLLKAIMRTICSNCDIDLLRQVLILEKVFAVGSFQVRFVMSMPVSKGTGRHTARHNHDNTPLHKIVCGGIITKVTSHATFLTITTQKLPKPRTLVRWLW